MGFKADVYVAMVVRWGFHDACVRSYGCALAVSRRMYIAMVVHWGFQGRCVRSYGCALRVSRRM